MSVSVARDAVQRLKRHVVGEYLVRRNPLHYGRARHTLDALEAMDLAQRRAWSRARLAQALRRAARTAYGREVGGRNGLKSWPLLEKEPLRDRLKKFLTGHGWLGAPASTGGTTGIPLKLVRSLECVVFEQACLDRLIEAVGADPRLDRVAILRGDNIKDPSDLRPPHWIRTNGGRCLVMSSNILKPETVADFADALEEFQPRLLCAYPTSLECLSRLLQQCGRRLHIPCVLTSSEVLKPEAWTLAQATLGCTIADHYGQAERVAFAYTFAPREYRFQPAYGYVELVPFNAHLLDPGQDALYEIVGTPFWNPLMPLVRYRTGDLVRLPASWGATELEELALGLRTFCGVLGREQEILVCPKGVRLTGIGSIPRDVKHVLRIQVIQETLEEVRLLVLPAPGFSKRDAQQLMENARAKVPDAMRVTIEKAEWLERTPRGKTPLVVHRPPVHQRLREAGIEPSVTH